MDGFDPAEFVTLVRRFAIRSTVLPPAAMTMLADDPSITDLAPLRFVRSITAPLSPLQARRFNDRFGISVLNGYGQTEIGGEIVGWNAADSREHGRTKLGSVGRPHEGVSLRVVDEGGTDVPAGEPGELWVLTPALSGGYADGTDLSDRLSPDGWFRTGDFARIDAEGFVWIEGRVSDQINRGGMKIVPTTVDPDVAKMQEPHRGKPFEFVVERIEAPRRISFRWHPYAIEPGVDYSREPMTTIVFELKEVQEGVELTITESGFDRIPLARRAEAFKANEGGWEHQMRLIAKYLQRQPAA